MNACKQNVYYERVKTRQVSGECLYCQRCGVAGRGLVTRVMRAAARVLVSLRKLTTRQRSNVAAQPPL